jgi:hypothetical protein
MLGVFTPHIGMKKMIVVIALLMVGLVCFADEAEQRAFVRVSTWLDAGLYRNFSLIQTESIYLTPSQRVNLVDVYQKSVGLPFALNLFLGFGIGSFSQGDATGGWITLLGEAAGIAGVVVGVTMMPLAVNDMAPYPPDDYYPYNGYPNNNVDIASALIVGGTLLYLGTRIFELIRPFTFANSYNTKLKRALNYYNMSYNIVPAFDMKGTTTVVASLSFKF